MDLEHLLATIKNSEHYRIIEKYKKPEYYHVDNNCSKHIGVFIDVETTGLDHIRDKIIELGLVCFEYSSDGRIFSILEEYNSYEDPKCPIPTHITELTGISDEMVRGHNIDIDKVKTYIKNANLIIAHNAAFDRKFIENRIPSLEKKPWGCLMKDIKWKAEGIESPKLEYIAYRCGFFYEGHRAVNDCLAGVHVLSHKLPKSEKYVLHSLLENSSQNFIKLYAVKAHYDYKDILKSRGYKWVYCKDANTQAWAIEIPENLVAYELEYLRSKIYNSKVSLPFEIIDGYSRFSISELEQNYTRHRDIIERVSLL